MQDSTSRGQKFKRAGTEKVSVTSLMKEMLSLFLHVFIYLFIYLLYNYLITLITKI